MTVDVRQADFGTSIVGYVNCSRPWSLPLIGTNVLLEWDNQIAATNEMPLANGGRQFTILPLAEGNRYVLARTYAGGPILASGKVQCAFFHGTDDTRSTYTVETSPDGTEILESTFVADMIPPGGYAKLVIFVAGVTFDDGTTTKYLYGSDFDATGVARVRFIYPAGSRTSYCHHIYLYDANNLQVGYIQ